MGELPEHFVSHLQVPSLKLELIFCKSFLAKAHNLKSLRFFKLYICVFVCYSTKAVRF